MRSLHGFAASSLRWIAIGLIAAISVASATNARAENGSASLPQPEREWTFLVYLNGHNNLDPFGLTNLRDMEKVGSTDRVNVVVQWASLRNPTTKRLFVQKKTGTGPGLASTVVEELPTVDMGDYRSLVEFVRWGAQNFPAKKYFVNVWNHGGGWHLSQKALAGLEFSPTDISWDDKTGHSIKTEELGVAMAQMAGIIGHKVDVYGSDACLMGMAEVASEMTGSVDAFVGSQEVEPGAGWPYDGVLAAWNSLPDASPLEVGKALAQAYVKSYLPGGTNPRADVTMSVYDMSKLAQFESAAKSFASALARGTPSQLQKALRIAKNAQSFDFEDYVDVVDFATALSKESEFSALSEIAGINAAAASLTYYNETTSGYRRAHGVSVWIPTEKYLLRQYLARYKGLKFDNATGWSSFLQAMMP